MPKLTRQVELEAIEKFIAEHGITKLPPFDERQARRKWRLTGGTIAINGDGRRAPEKTQ